MVLCTYCGSLSISTNKCSNCGGHFDLLSRQRTQNGMGPWFIRDQVNPFHPGCSYETLRRLVARGRVRPDTVMRGPTTRQFWSFARNTPGVAHLLGACHACHTPVDSQAVSCPSCNASFIVVSDRQQLGLAPIQMLPGEADPSAVADAAFGTVTPAPGPAPRATDPLPALTGADDLSETTSQASPVRQSPIRPARRRSAGPMVAVAASVACAVIALTAVVYMNRSDGTPGSVEASESIAGPIPTAPETADRRSDRQRAPALGSAVLDSASDSPDQVDEDAATLLDESPQPASESRGETLAPTDQETEERVASTDPATETTPPQADLGLEAAVVGALSASELVEARAVWAADGRKSLVAAADRRAQQLRLRASFAPD